MSQITVTFSPWEYELGFQVGIRRYTANWDTKDAAHYDRALMEEDRKASVSSALCELAVAKHLNQYWHASIWCAAAHKKHRNPPDVGTNVEVRRLRTAPGVAVRQTDAGRTVWAARIDDPEFRSCLLLGSVDANYALKAGIHVPGKDYVLVPTDELDPPE